jgi:hypothetical protein
MQTGGSVLVWVLPITPKGRPVGMERGRPVAWIPLARLLQVSPFGGFYRRFLDAVPFDRLKG